MGSVLATSAGPLLRMGLLVPNAIPGFSLRPQEIAEPVKLVVRNVRTALALVLPVNPVSRRTRVIKLAAILSRRRRTLVRSAPKAVLATVHNAASVRRHVKLAVVQRPMTASFVPRARTCPEAIASEQTGMAFVKGRL